MEKVFYHLVALGSRNYERELSKPYRIVLTHQSREMFNVNVEKWALIPKCSLILNKNKTYQITGKLSWYDMEVLEKAKFKEIITK